MGSSAKNIKMRFKKRKLYKLATNSVRYMTISRLLVFPLLLFLFPSNSHDGSPPNMLEATQHYPQNRTRSKSSSRSLKEESANTSVRWWSLVLLLSHLLDKVSKKLE